MIARSFISLGIGRLTMGTGSKAGIVRQRRWDSQAAAQVASTLQVLATPSRLDDPHQLRNGPLPCVTDLAEAIARSSPPLHQLRGCGISAWSGDRAGRGIVYSLTTRMWRGLTKPFTTASTCTLVSPTGTFSAG